MKIIKSALILITLFSVLTCTSCGKIAPVKTENSSEGNLSSDENLSVKVEEIPSKKMLLPENLSEERNTEITHIVIHFMSNVMEKPKSPFEVNDMLKIYNDYGISSHYLIDRNGEIIKCVEESHTAYHAGKGTLNNSPDYENKLNRYSIGIEIIAIGSQKDMAQYFPDNEYNGIDKNLIGFKDEQYASLEKLLRNICERYDTLEYDRQHIIGHNEYSPLKTDPGELFDWSKIGL